MSDKEIVAIMAAIIHGQITKPQRASAGCGGQGV
jgi:hypothetical protein